LITALAANALDFVKSELRLAERALFRLAVEPARLAQIEALGAAIAGLAALDSPLAFAMSVGPL
jgi:hypothetical protein